MNCPYCHADITEIMDYIPRDITESERYEIVWHCHACKNEWVTDG